MRKGFTRRPQADESATGGKNYITPSGLQRLKEEHLFLLTRERPAVTKVVAWAASNGDRSENADYQHGLVCLRFSRKPFSHITVLQAPFQWVPQGSQEMDSAMLFMRCRPRFCSEIGGR